LQGTTLQVNSLRSLLESPLFRLEGVGRTFTMGLVAVDALKNVTLEIAPGELLVIVGPSGSGKSTLLNLLGGMDHPTAGRLWYRDQELTAASQRELTQYRRDTVGFVFQFYNLVPNLTARENVMVSTEISRDPLDVDEALSLVGLDDRRDHFPSQMSGGEQQRVAIARALAKNPQLLLCDEPTGALDFATGKKVLRLLSDVGRDMGKTVLIITHNAAITQIAQRVVRLRSGEVVEIKENPEPLAPEEITW
jgi:putative ABC transport system ATP-binding protein